MEKSVEFLNKIPAKAKKKASSASLDVDDIVYWQIILLDRRAWLKYVGKFSNAALLVLSSWKQCLPNQV